MAADREGQRAARAIRAARSLSRSLVWLVPENTSMSPDLASRTCTMIGTATVLASPWPCEAVLIPGAALAACGVGVRVAATAGLAAAPMAVTARPAAPAVAAPCSRERRDRRRPGDPDGSGPDARFSS